MQGRIPCISPNFLGEKITDLQMRREQAANAPDDEDEEGASEQARVERGIARRAYAAPKPPPPCRGPMPTWRSPRADVTLSPPTSSDEPPPMRPMSPVLDPHRTPPSVPFTPSLFAPHWALPSLRFKESVDWKSGAPGDGPDISVVSFCGKWLPLGEGSKRTGELVITIRETIGWKYDSKPPPPGKDAKPSASRAIGLLIREMYIDTDFYEEPPFAPGLSAAWALHEQRHGR